MRLWFIAMVLLAVSGCASSEGRVAAAGDEAETGLVILKVTVGQRGEVVDADILTEEPKGRGFGYAALMRARAWVFEDSKPGDYTITMRFVLEDESSP